jgi:hypothetical protein
MLRPAETTPLDLEASLLLDFYIRLRIGYKPLNRSWCLSLRSQLSGIVLREHSLTNVELRTWGKSQSIVCRRCAATPIILIPAGGAVDRFVGKIWRPSSATARAPPSKPPVLARAAMLFRGSRKASPNESCFGVWAALSRFVDKGSIIRKECEYRRNASGRK